MSATTVTVDQRRLHDMAELPAGLAQSILSASRAAAKLSKTRWLLVHCPVSNRIRRDVWLVDDALNEAPERRAARIIRLTSAARPADEVSSAESMFGGVRAFWNQPGIQPCDWAKQTGSATTMTIDLSSIAATFNRSGHGRRRRRP
jgi:hypothetical protein